MSYDAWKTRSPDDECDYEREPEDDCSHEEYDIGWEGRALCDRCGYSWWASAEQLEDWHRHQREYAEWVEQEYRREFWRKLTYPIRWPFSRLLERIWPRKANSVLTDDEIPF